MVQSCYSMLYTYSSSSFTPRHAGQSMIHFNRTKVSSSGWLVSTPFVRCTAVLFSSQESFLGHRQQLCTDKCTNVQTAMANKYIHTQTCCHILRDNSEQDPNKMKFFGEIVFEDDRHRRATPPPHPPPLRLPTLGGRLDNEHNQLWEQMTSAPRTTNIGSCVRQELASYRFQKPATHDEKQHPHLLPLALRAGHELLQLLLEGANNAPPKQTYYIPE